MRVIGPEDAAFTRFKELLDEGGQPTDDLSEPAQTFYMLGEGAAFGGYAIYGRDVLLRSIVVAPDQRGTGVGVQIVQHLLERAAAEGAGCAWLLTVTAAQFFRGLGFADVSRDDAPKAIASTKQFALHHPDEIAFQRKPL